MQATGPDDLIEQRCGVSIPAGDWKGEVALRVEW